MTHSCLNCESDFQPARANNRYCSQSCRQQAYIKRNWVKTGEKTANSTDFGFAGISGLPANIEPAKLLELLSNLVKNPSLTDKLTDRAEKPVATRVYNEKSSQTVNDGLTDQAKKELISAQNAYDNTAKEIQVLKKTVEKSIFQTMIENGYTIEIGPRGFVRGLFPHWSDKEWEFAKYANGKMMQLVGRLQKAAMENVITRKKLKENLQLVSDFTEGPLAFCLPIDYPFKKFWSLLRVKLETLLINVSDNKQINFRISESLNGMLNTLSVQIGSNQGG